MSKFLKIFLFFIVSSLVIGGVLYIAGISIEPAEPQKTAESFAEKETPKKTPEQIKMEDFEYNHQKLNRDYESLVGEDSYLSDVEEFYAELEVAYKEEIAYYIEEYGENATDKVIFLVNTIPVIGEYNVGRVKGYYYTVNPCEEKTKKAKSAHRTINNICDYVLNLAIPFQFEKIIKSILLCYKPDINEIKYDLPDPRPNGGTSYYDYHVTIKYTSRDAAKKRVQESFVK